MRVWASCVPSWAWDLPRRFALRVTVFELAESFLRLVLRSHALLAKPELEKGVRRLVPIRKARDDTFELFGRAGKLPLRVQPEASAPGRRGFARRGRSARVRRPDPFAVRTFRARRASGRAGRDRLGAA